MAALGNMVVNLTANTTQFQNSMKRAQGTVSKFAATATRMAKTAAIGGIAAAGAAAYKTAGQFGELDKIAKTSDKLGIAAKNMGGLQLAFEQTGVSANAGFTAMQRMTRRISEAANGTGPAVKALNELGLSAQALETMSPDMALQRVADAMKGVQGQSDKMRLAFSLFDSEGVGLVNTLAGGSAGLQAFQKTAESLSMTHTREELARVEQANDAINRVSKNVTGSFQKLAIVSAPVIEKVASGFQTMISGAHNFSASVLQSVGLSGSSFGELYASMTRGVTTAYTVMTYGIENWQSIAELAFKTASLNAITFGKDVGHFFTTKLPAYLNWFGDNWGKVFATSFDAVTTGFINLAKNIQSTWSSIIGFITGNSSSLEFTWIPLMKGYKNTIASLPDIPERALSDLEINMNADVRALQTNLGGGLQQRIDDNLKMLESIKPPEMKLPEIEPIDVSQFEVPQAVSKAAETTDRMKQATEKPQMASPQTTGVMQQGSEEAANTIAKSMMNYAQDKQLKEQKKQSGIQKEMAGHMKSMNAAMAKGFGFVVQGAV